MKRTLSNTSIGEGTGSQLDNPDSPPEAANVPESAASTQPTVSLAPRPTTLPDGSLITEATQSPAPASGVFSSTEPNNEPTSNPKLVVRAAGESGRSEIINAPLPIVHPEAQFLQGMEALKAQDFEKARYWFLLSAQSGYRPAKSWLGPMPARGDTHAQYCLGLKYEAGIGVAKSFTQAEVWYRIAAEQGHPIAQRNLGVMHEYGRGTTLDYSQAAEWYRRAAEQGDACAQTNLALLYLTGDGVDQDVKLVEMWCLKAANQGYARAQTALAEMYENGIGVETDLKRAAEWYRKAAEQGDALAQTNLGHMYWNGLGVEWDSTVAAEWYRKAAEQGDASAQFELGMLYLNGDGVEKNDAKAAKWFRKAAEKGNSFAQEELAGLYEKGEGVKKNIQQVVAWYRKALENGDDSALIKLGGMYRNHEGFELCLDDAKQVFWKAVEHGNADADADAETTLGYLYEGGEYLSRNYEMAIFWYRKAAEKDHALASTSVGKMYMSGRGVEQDFSQASVWLRKAANQAYEPAQKILDHISVINVSAEKNVFENTYLQLLGGLETEGNKNKIIFSFKDSEESTACILDVLKRFHEFKNVNIFNITTLKFNEAELSVIDGLIRSFPEIRSLFVECKGVQNQSTLINFADRLTNTIRLANHSLIDLRIKSEEFPLPGRLRLDQLLDQNKIIFDLRQELRKRPPVLSDELPLEVLMKVVDELIVNSVRGGKSQEATWAAVDEFLISAQFGRMTSLPRQSAPNLKPLEQ